MVIFNFSAVEPSAQETPLNRLANFQQSSSLELS
jgi:hypothetical protein